MPRLNGYVNGASGVYIFGEADGVFYVSNNGHASPAYVSAGSGVYTLSFDSSRVFPRTGDEIAPARISYAKYMRY